MGRIRDGVGFSVGRIGRTERGQRCGWVDGVGCGRRGPARGPPRRKAVGWWTNLREGRPAGAALGPRRESVARLGLDGGRQFEGGISQSGCPDRDFCCFVAVLVAYASAAKIQKSEPGDC